MNEKDMFLELEGIFEETLTEHKDSKGDDDDEG